MENPLKVSLENIIPLTEARDHFSQIVSEVQKDKLYVLTKGGKPAVAIIDVKYLEHITGGEVKKEYIQEEIKKAPEKVGLPPMVEHYAPAPASASVPPPSAAGQPPKPAPLQMPKTEAPNQPAGFAAPQPAPSPAPQTPPPTTPAAAPSTGPTPLKTPSAEDEKKEKIDVQFSIENPPEKKTAVDGKLIAPDDKNPPAQYAGSSDSEPEDMALD